MLENIILLLIISNICSIFSLIFQFKEDLRAGGVTEIGNTETDIDIEKSHELSCGKTRNFCKKPVLTRTPMVINKYTHGLRDNYT